jgi:hypothetical protein
MYAKKSPLCREHAPSLTICGESSVTKCCEALDRVAIRRRVWSKSAFQFHFDVSSETEKERYAV